MVWDDRKTGDYAFQTDFSYRMNQLSRRSWLVRNAAAGAALGLVMAAIVYLVPSYYFSDPTRMVFALFVGVWPVKFVEKTAERTTKMATAAMAAAFALGTVAYSLSLLLR